MSEKSPDPQWYDLSEAADFLGVHFTTLRRWADQGEIDHFRTPGGKRRFTRRNLEAFLEKNRQQSQALATTEQLEDRALFKTRQSLQAVHSTGASWMQRIDPEKRMLMRGTGHRIMALLMQFNSRSSNAQLFLDEGNRIAAEYGQICQQAGLTVSESLQAFMTFRSSILDSIHETSDFVNIIDSEGQNLYHRSSQFLDAFLIAMVDAFCAAEQQS